MEKLTPILECLAIMTDAHKELEIMKSEVKDRCYDAYKQYGKTVEFGDDPPSQKALESMAKAQAKNTVNKFSSDLKDLAKALMQCTGEDTGLLPGMG